MVDGSSTKRLGLEVDDSGVVGHVGLWLLGGFADRLGVGDALSGVFDRSGVVHDRGKVLVHAMLMLAGGGECCTDVEFLRSEPGLFGSTVSDSTLYRTMRGIDKQRRVGLAGALAGVRERVWNKVDTDPGAAVVLDIDASVHVVHSENKEGAAPTYKRSYGFHPIYCFSDLSGECLSVLLRPGNAGANTVADHVQVLDEAVDVLPEHIGVGHREGDNGNTVRWEIRVRADSAAGPTFAKKCRERRVGFSFVARKTGRIQEAINLIGVDDPRWEAAVPNRPTPSNNSEPRAHVADLTDLVDTGNWPPGARLIVRREPRHPGAQRSLFPSDDYRYWGHWTDNTADAAESDRDMRAHARVEDHIARLKTSGAQRFPFTDFENQPRLAGSRHLGRHTRPLVPTPHPRRYPPPAGTTQNITLDTMAHPRQAHTPRPTKNHTHPPNLAHRTPNHQHPPTPPNHLTNPNTPHRTAHTQPEHAPNREAQPKQHTPRQTRHTPDPKTGTHHPQTPPKPAETRPQNRTVNNQG